MEFKDYLAIAAITLSLLAFILGFWNRITSERKADANLYMARYSNLEVNLAVWHDALKLYGISLEEAKVEGVSAEMISYLILFINGIHAKCKATGNSLSYELNNSEMRKRIFSNPDTINTWKFAKKAFSKKIIDGIDDFLDK